MLVVTEEKSEFNVHMAEPRSDWPNALVQAVTAANIPVVESESIRTKDIWTVYSDRVREPTRLGAKRTTWIEQDHKFFKLHEKISNPTIEWHMERFFSDGRGSNSDFYREFVGRIHALIADGSTNVFLTKYTGYESNRGKLERLHNGEFQTLRVDGFDQGC
ncbi:hypothetical protein C6500_00200 [Candidatus Poribacteria bacterium]|nr:MAG: hypothetical protein C6500_00200 [Candidatus Poribacteria bacterium]